MWLLEEQTLFGQANFHNSYLEYEKALAISDRLLALLTNDPKKFAYVLACRKAVALRHLGRTEEAETAFSQAYDMAKAADEPVISAYILNDWSSMHTGDKALQMVREALRLCEEADETPDPERVLEADKAYFKATLAHTLENTGFPAEIRDLLTEAKQTLKGYAHGSHPRYQQAYFIVLLWDLKSQSNSSPLALLYYAGRLGAFVVEAIRQGKIDVAFRRIAGRT